MAIEFNIDKAVRERYVNGARERQESLCCPVSYDPRYLEVIPREVIERDYGCGDPTPYLKLGDTVLDLGSGSVRSFWAAFCGRVHWNSKFHRWGREPAPAT
jgi:hypothetical protein